MGEQSLGESREDYLEAIYIQINKNGACRPTDVALFLGRSKPSVTVALQKLEQEGYIRREDWKVLLTEEGKVIAAAMDRKHHFFKTLLMKAGVEETVAEKEACHIEHVISEDSFEKVCAYMKNTHGEDWEDLV